MIQGDKTPEEELSPVTGIEEDSFYKSTCENCDHRGNRRHDEDWIRIGNTQSHLRSDSKCIEISKYPQRCKECDTNYKRWKRMYHSNWKIMCVIHDMTTPTLFSRPKMMTITNKDNLSKLEFNSRWKTMRDSEPWIIGGTYVLEQGKKNGMNHMHGVFIAPYFGKEFRDLTLARCSEQYGLGNVHYQVAQLNELGRDYHLENYLSKYLCKEGNRKQSFGALYRCKQDPKSKMWHQPNQTYSETMAAISASSLRTATILNEDAVAYCGKSRGQ